MLQTVSNIANYTVNNNVNWTAPIKRSTVTDFTNPLFPRNIMISNNGIQVSRPNDSVGIAIADLMTLVVAVNPNLTWPPYFSTQPANTNKKAGDSATFTIALNSELSPTYQWKYSNDGGVTWANATGGVYSGDTSVTLSISDVSGLNTYLYECIATNALGSVTSIQAELFVDPDVTLQPADHSVVAPAPWTFTITATGTGSLAYNWQYSSDGGSTWHNASGGVYTNNTTNALTITDSTGLDTYKFRCQVTNAIGTGVSHAATLTVT
jgi:hypothetical protein